MFLLHTTTYVKIRSLKNHSIETFVNKLAKAKWEDCFLAPDINQSWKLFQEFFLDALDHVAPLKEIRLKQLTEPWMNSEILDLISERDKKLKLFKRSQNSDIYKEYCHLRNKIQKLIKNAKSNYFENKIEENKGDSKSLWKQFKNSIFIMCPKILFLKNYAI